MKWLHQASQAWSAFLLPWEALSLKDGAAIASSEDALLDQFAMPHGYRLMARLMSTH